MDRGGVDKCSSKHPLATQTAVSLEHTLTKSHKSHRKLLNQVLLHPTGTAQGPSSLGIPRELLRLPKGLLKAHRIPHCVASTSPLEVPSGNFLRPIKSWSNTQDLFQAHQACSIPHELLQAHELLQSNCCSFSQVLQGSDKSPSKLPTPGWGQVKTFSTLC